MTVGSDSATWTRTHTHTLTRTFWAWPTHLAGRKLVAGIYPSSQPRSAYHGMSLQITILICTATLAMPQICNSGLWISSVEWGQQLSTTQNSSKTQKVRLQFTCDAFVNLQKRIRATDLQTRHLLPSQTGACQFQNINGISSTHGT